MEEALRDRPRPHPHTRMAMVPARCEARPYIMRAALTVQLDLLDGDHVAHVDAALLRAELLKAEGLRSGAQSLRPDLEQPATEIFREAVPVERNISQHKQPLDPVRPHGGGELSALLVQRHGDTDEVVWVNKGDFLLHWLFRDVHS